MRLTEQEKRVKGVEEVDVGLEMTIREGAFNMSAGGSQFFSISHKNNI